MACLPQGLVAHISPKAAQGLDLQWARFPIRQLADLPPARVAVGHEQVQVGILMLPFRPFPPVPGRGCVHGEIDPRQVVALAYSRPERSP